MNFEPEWEEWNSNKTPENMSKILKKFTPIIRKELPKYKGNLPRPIMESYAKKFLLDSVRSYNPAKARLSTHIVTNMQQAHRVNYDSSSTMRMSEELRRGVNQYKHIKEYLTDKYGREPNASEMADELGWTVNKVNRTNKSMKSEATEGSFEFSPDTSGMQDPRIDYVYHDLNSKNKFIFEHSTGYRGAPIMQNQDIAKKLRITPGAVSLRKQKISSFIKKTLGGG